MKVFRMFSFVWSTFSNWHLSKSKTTKLLWESSKKTIKIQKVILKSANCLFKNWFNSVVYSIDLFFFEIDLRKLLSAKKKLLLLRKLCLKNEELDSERKQKWKRNVRRRTFNNISGPRTRWFFSEEIVIQSFKEH